MHQAPREQKAHEQNRHRIRRGGARAEVKCKTPEQRAHHHALQAVGPAGEAVETVGQFQQHEGHAHGDHEAREVGSAHDHRAGDEAEQTARCACHDQAGERVGQHPFGKQTCRIGTRTEEGRMAKRDDAGVAQDQIEREGEQGQDGDFVDQRRMRRKRHQRSRNAGPRCPFQTPPARVGQEARCGKGAQRLGLQASNPPKPCGRHSRIAIIST